MNDTMKRTLPPTWSWQTLSPWIVPPIVIPGALIVWFMSYVIYRHFVA